MNMINLFISLLLTALIYLFVPLIFAVRAQRKSLSSIKKIIIINGVAIYIFFTAINFLSGIEKVANISATFIWSYIGFVIMKKRCLKSNDGFVIDIAENPIHCAETSTTETPKKYCKLCGNLIDNASKQCTDCRKQYFKGFRTYKYPIIISVLISITVVVLTIGTVRYTKTKQEIKSLQTNIEKLKEKNSALRNKNAELQKDLKRIKKYTSKYQMDEDGTIIQIY